MQPGSLKDRLEPEIQTWEPSGVSDKWCVWADRIGKETKNEPNRTNHGGTLTLGWVREIVEVEREAVLKWDKKNQENTPPLSPPPPKKETELQKGGVSKEWNRESEEEEDWGEEALWGKAGLAGVREGRCGAGHMNTELLYIISDARVSHIESLGSWPYCHLVLINSILEGANSIWDPEVLERG